MFNLMSNFSGSPQLDAPLIMDWLFVKRPVFSAYLSALLSM